MFFDEFLSKYRRFKIELKQFPFVKCKGEIYFKGCNSFRELSGSFTPEKNLSHRQLDVVSKALEEYILKFLEEVRLEEAFNISIDIENDNKAIGNIYFRYVPQFDSKYANIVLSNGYLFLDNLLNYSNGSIQFKIKHNIDNLAEDIYNKKNIKVSLYTTDEEEKEVMYFDIDYLDNEKPNTCNFLTCVTVNYKLDHPTEKIPIMYKEAEFMLRELTYKTDLGNYYKKSIELLADMVHDPSAFMHKL